MTAKKGFLRRVFDAVAEGRARQAERYINQYYAETQTRAKGRFGDSFTDR